MRYLQVEIFRFAERWSLLAGARGYAEAAYGANRGRYSDAVRERDSHELLMRDFYLEYKSGTALVRLGNQQVVWGEAFGFYFADIVNPKDLREYGLGDLTDQRLQVPMLNAKLLFSRTQCTGLVRIVDWKRLERCLVSQIVDEPEEPSVLTEQLQSVSAGTILCRNRSLLLRDRSRDREFRRISRDEIGGAHRPIRFRRAVL